MHRLSPPMLFEAYLHLKFTPNHTKAKYILAELITTRGYRYVTKAYIYTDIHYAFAVWCHAIWRQHGKLQQLKQISHLRGTLIFN